MSIETLQTLIGLAAVGAGAAFLIFSLRSMTADEVSLRLHEYVGEQVTAPSLTSASMLSLRQAELAGSFNTRILLPLVNRLGRLFGRMTPARVMDDLRRQLTMAGSPLGLGPREFYGFRLILTLVGFAVAAGLILGKSAPAAPAGTVGATRAPTITLEDMGVAVFVLFLGARLPSSWLRGRVRARQNRIRRALPDALDMLSVCADAGLGFDQALQRLSESWKSPLAVEFARVVAEMQMGMSRQAAMRNLAYRTDVPELNSFVAVIIQSDQLGMSISQTLHAQAEQMRVERRHRAQEEARKIPLKMLFPMLLFMLPAMFAVVLGPAAIEMQEIFATLRNNQR